MAAAHLLRVLLAAALLLLASAYRGARRAQSVQDEEGEHGPGCGMMDPDIRELAANSVEVSEVTYHNEATEDLRATLVAEQEERRRRMLAEEGRELQTSLTYPGTDRGYKPPSGVVLPINNQSNSYIPLSVLHQYNLTVPLRIKVVWDAIDSGDVKGSRRYQCICAMPGAKKTITGTQLPKSVRDAQAGTVPCDAQKSSIFVAAATGNAEVAYTCAESNVITPAGFPANLRRRVLEARTLAAVRKWGSGILRVRPVTSAIVPTAAVKSDFSLNCAVNGCRYTDTDLVIIITARPSPNKQIAGFAICRQRDQYNRCVVGQFNWVPELFNLPKMLDAQQIGAETHTALHEFAHLLGAVIPGKDERDTPFLHAATGALLSPIPSKIINASFDVYGKPMQYIQTSRVVAVARKYIGCDKIRGVPLEDISMGAGAHWDARLLGAEFMAYGTWTGLAYISDLTLAFLEDTNQYIADYSLAGRFTPDYRDKYGVWRGVDADVAAGLAVRDQEVIPAAPGALLWGRNAGCDWWFGNPKKQTTPADGPWGKFVCQRKGQKGCTPDNRYAATCAIKNTWNGRAPQCASKGQFPTPASETCEAAWKYTSDGLPAPLVYYGGVTQASAATGIPNSRPEATGGNYDAMEFLPLYVGYMGCQDVNWDPDLNVATALSQAANTSGAVDDGSYDAFQDKEKGAISDLADDFAGPDVKLRGGQIQCKDCRCFDSSLEAMTGGTPKGSKFGQCYRFNCYRPDYLQIGVGSLLYSERIYYYRCPVDGGRLYVPGFTGGLFCPPAEEFCRTESISGAKYAEVNVFFVLIFWVGGSSAVGLLALCCMVPPIQRRVVLCCKRCCGVMVWEEELVDLRFKAPLSASSRMGTTARSLASEEEEGSEGGSPRRPAIAVGTSGSCLDRLALRFIFGLNSFSMLAALLLLGASAYAIAVMKAVIYGVPLLVLGALVLLVSFLGLCAARNAKYEDEPASCWILSYFFASLGLLVLLLFGVVYVLTVSDWKNYVTSEWDQLSVVIPAALRPGDTKQLQIAAVVQLIKGYMYALGGLALTILLIYMFSLYAASRLIRIRTLAAMTVILNSHAILFLGAIFLAAAGFIGMNGALTSPQASSVVIFIAIIGVFSVFTAAVTEAGMYKRQLPLLHGAIGLQVVFAAFAAGAAFIFVSEKESIAGFIASIKDTDVAKMSTSIGLSFTKGELVARLTDNLMQLALACGVLLALLVVLITDTGIIILELKRLRAHSAMLRSGKGAAPMMLEEPPQEIEAPVEDEEAARKRAKKERKERKERKEGRERKEGEEGKERKERKERKEGKEGKEKKRKKDRADPEAGDAGDPGVVAGHNPMHGVAGERFTAPPTVAAPR